MKTLFIFVFIFGFASITWGQDVASPVQSIEKVTAELNDAAATQEPDCALANGVDEAQVKSNDDIKKLTEEQNSISV